MMLTDFHSHILPGVDDGSKDVEQSLQMLRMSAEQGVSRMVATPHFYPRHDDPQRFLQRRARAFEELQKAMAMEQGLPCVELGAEVYFFKGISDCEEIRELTLGNSKYILVEMPMTAWTANMYQELEWVYTKQGLIPVVAHLDRYIRPLTCGKVLRELSKLPVLIQVNAEFFLERSTASLALRMLRKEQIHLLGSDCHNLSDRKPDLGAAVKLIQAKLGEAALERVQGFADKIL